MTLFTANEKRSLCILLGALIIGLLVQQWRTYASSTGRIEPETRAKALWAFKEASERYKDHPGDGNTAAWSFEADGPLDINRAALEQFMALHGVGPVLAKKIIDYRLKNGYFQTVQDLQNIKGIGPKLVMRWEKLLVVQPDTSVGKGFSIE